jgi:hypothetical protein
MIDRGAPHIEFCAPRVQDGRRAYPHFSIPGFHRDLTTLAGMLHFPASGSWRSARSFKEQKMPYTIDVKHDTRHKTWKRLSVTAILPDCLVADLDAYVAQYAADQQMNVHQVAGRVVEIDSSQIGSIKDVGFKSIVMLRESAATANNPNHKLNPDR